MNFQRIWNLITQKESILGSKSHKGCYGNKITKHANFSFKNLKCSYFTKIHEKLQSSYDKYSNLQLCIKR